MTKEQEQAIEWTKNVIKTIEESQMLFLEDITVKLGTMAHNNLQEILNLIQTLLTKIERLNNLNSHQDKEIKRAVDYTFELNAELEKKDKRILALEYALLDMIMQFADRPHKNGCEYAISTMGLSALELAFNELELDDPTPVKKANEMYEKLQEQYFEK